MSYPATYPAPTSPPSREPFWRRLALVLAVVAVGLIVALMSGGGSSGKASATASGKDSLTLACDQVRAIPDAGFVIGRDDAAAGRLGVAYTAAMLAESQDRSLAVPAAAVMKVQDAVSATFRANDPEFISSLRAAKAACQPYRG